VRILVAGGAGFIGSHVVDRLVELGHEVAALDDLSTGQREFIHRDARLFEADITDRDAVEACLTEWKPEVVDHHAAQIDVRHLLPRLDYTVLRYPNVYGPRQNPHGEEGVNAIFIGLMLHGKQPRIFGTGEQLPRAGEVQRIYLDATRAERVLGWRPRTPFPDGLAKTIAWSRAAGV